MKRFIFITLVFTAIFWLANVNAQYTGPFYVAPYGNDFNNGSYTNPFKTIQHAANVMSAGPPQCTVATTYIFSGVYNEQVNIFSNKNPGYMVFTALSNNNKPVLKNIFGPPLNYAFFITNADNIRLQNMEINGYSRYGIYLTGDSTNIHIENNIISSNTAGGIRIVQEANDNNYIVSNTILGGNQNNGIEITWGDNTYIYGNKIFGNQQIGIWLYWGADNNYISHNEIYNNNSYGLNFTTTGNQCYTNQIYHNNTGVSIAYGANNVIKSNTIYSNNGRGIEFSQCNNNAIISNQIFGNNQEGIYLEYNGHQVIGNKIFQNSFGIHAQGKTNQIINNEIYRNQQGIILSLSTNYYIADNTIYSNNFENIRIDSAINTTISNNTLFHSGINNWASGIWIGGDAIKDLYIKNNLIYSNVYQTTNFSQAIFIQANTATNIIIFSNEIYGCGGIRNEGADFVQIKNNYLHNLEGWSSIEIDTNWNGGIESYANSNTVISNTVYGRGISIYFGNGHIVRANTIRDVTNGSGIRVFSVSNFLIRGNDIQQSSEAINVDSSSGNVVYNTVLSNGRGISIEGPSSLNVKFNRIAFNTNEGLQIDAWSGYPSANIRKNNFAQNNINFATSTNYDVRTNWWGTSKKGIILSKFGFYGPNIQIDFEPYRLWHAFNLLPGADTDSLPSVTGFTSTIINNTNVKLTWNKSPTNDFEYYCIYRSSQNDYGKLTHTTNYIIATTTNTNYTDIPGYGVFYYWVTVVDNPEPPTGNVFTNESWYSKMQSVTIGTGTNVWNATQNKWYWTIQSAVNEANTSDTLVVYPYGYPVSGSKVYQEKVEISTNTTSASNLKIIAYNWTNSGTIDTVIDGTGNNSAIEVSDYRSIELHGFRIKNDSWHGFKITGDSSGNIITHNIFYSNNPAWSGSGMPPFGLLIQSDKANYNIIGTNEFYNNVVDLGIGGGNNNSVFSNKFHNSLFEGVALFDDSGIAAKHNTVKNNLIYDMPGNGIGLHTMAVSNTVMSNTIYNSTNGIYMEGGGGGGPQGVFDNLISFNKVYNTGNGFDLANGVWAAGNRIVHNIVTNNIHNGFYISSSNFNNNLIASNFIAKNNSGIYIEFGFQNSIASNRIIYNTNGVYIYSSPNNIIEHNILNNNSSYGFIATNAPSTTLQLNNIVSNNIGVWMMSGSNTFITKNNLYSNTYNAQAPVNANGQYYTNNWWGTTIWTNITNTIMGPAPQSKDFMPWRLFGPFDISYGADTDTPTRVDKITSGIINGTDVVIKWQGTVDNGGGNVARYFIYKWFTNSAENVSRANVIGEVSASQTSFTDYGGWSGTNVYYSVTALDDYPTWTNESWYGKATSPSTNVYNVTKNTYYGTIKDAVYDADGGGVFNEIRVLKATNYYEQGITLDNDQNIKLVSSEWLNSGTYTNTMIITTNKDALSIFNVKLNGRLDIEGFTIQFAGTNEDWGAGNVSAALHYNDSSSGTVKHINFDGLNSGKIGILAEGWGSGSFSAISNRFTGFKKAGVHINRSGNIIANAFTNCNSGVELDGGSANSLVSNNIFKDNLNGVYCYGDDSNEKITYNLITGCNIGINCDVSSYPQIINNTIAHGGDTGVYANSNSSPVIKNNIIFSNANYGIYGVTGPNKANPNSSYNNVFGNGFGASQNWGGSALQGTGDISDNTPPIFIGGSPYDYHLADGSPSIAAGENSVDQGCYPYNALLRLLLGNNTKPPGSIDSTFTNQRMIQIKLRTERPDSVTFFGLIITNKGTSSSFPNLPLEVTNVSIYNDANGNGWIDAGDNLLGSGKFWGNNTFATLQGFSVTIPGNTETNFIITYDTLNAVAPETYQVSIIGSNVYATTNGPPITVYGSALGNVQTVVGGIDHFVILHDGNGYTYVPESVTIIAVDSNNNKIDSYSGTISLWVLNDLNEVEWANGNGSGTFTNGGIGVDWAKYTFTPYDYGDVQLYLTYYTQGWLNIECMDTATSATDDDIEGPLYFTNAPVWNATIDKYYANLQDAISEATPTNRNEIRIMYSYNDGNVLIATNTTSATQFYITSQEWKTFGTKNTILNSSGFDKAISVDSSGRPFSLRIEGFTIKNAYVNGIELLANTSSCTVANMVMLSNGYTVSNYPGPAGFGIYISDNQTVNNTIYSNKIYFSQWGIVVIDADNNKIYGNTLRYNRNPSDPNDGGGIVIASMGSPTTNNSIYNNIGVSNNTGIYLGYNGDMIFHNSVYSNDLLYNKTGIIIEDSDNDFVYGNYVAHNTNNGIYITGSASSNEVYGNSVFTNRYDGITVSSTNPQATGNLLYNNDIKGNHNGYYLEGALDTKVFQLSTLNFKLKNNTNAIYIFNSDNTIVSNIVAVNNINGIWIENATNIEIAYNYVGNNNTEGIKVSSCQRVKVMLNTIVSNDIGVWITNSSSFTLVKNNIYTNTTWNLETLNPGTLAVTNNWWGSTILSVIKSKVQGVTNIIPYRLFGEFDITPGADTDRLPAITWVTAVSFGSNKISVKWSKPSITNDFVRYFVYRSTNAGYTNLSRADVITQFYGATSTNFIDSPPTSDTYYYHITSLDGWVVYTNESWYSVEASATAGVFSIFVTNTNLFYTNISLNYTTLSQTTYISNDGTLPCKVVGQINDFTNYIYNLVWDVTNAGALSKDEIKVEVKTSPNGFIPNWTSIVNQSEIFTIDDNLPVGDVVELYIRVTTPPQTSSKGPYKSRIKASAQAP